MAIPGFSRRNQEEPRRSQEPGEARRGQEEPGGSQEVSLPWLSPGFPLGPLGPPWVPLASKKEKKWDLLSMRGGYRTVVLSGCSWDLLLGVPGGASRDS